MAMFGGTAVNIRASVGIPRKAFVLTRCNLTLLLRGRLTRSTPRCEVPYVSPVRAKLKLTNMLASRLAKTTVSVAVVQANTGTCLQWFKL